MAYKFKNWAGNVTGEAERYFQPTNENEIIELVKNAVAKDKNIKLVGAAHSWSALALPTHYLINLDKYSRVLNIDKEKKQVTVQAGIRLKTLNVILYENGLSLSNLGSVSEQSIAGATATGTHGTGIKFGNISTQIIGMKLILADGSVLTISEKENAELLPAVRINLGVLGIVSELTIQCVDVFNLRDASYALPFEETLEKIPELIQSTDHLKLWWFPHAPLIGVYRYFRTNEELQPRSAFQKFMDDSFLVNIFFVFLLRLGDWFPKTVPPINKLINKIHFKKVSRIEKTWEVFNVPMPPIHFETEYAIPVEHASEALKKLKEMIEHKKLRINFVVEVRFVKADNTWLSPAYKQDACYIGAYQYGNRYWKEYMTGFEELMYSFGGRPHWPKEFTPDSKKISNSFPEFEKFKQLKNKLDPKGVFNSALTQHLFA
ncbi:MAG: L-gulono-1,4-lactone dehydrogenase [Bacteroidia bacterium]|nr:L-gulono-1,4-lactone dehydrogenase [Bacteroidia bacterium]